MLLIFEPEVNIWLNLSPQRNGAEDIYPCLKSSPLFFSLHYSLILGWIDGINECFKGEGQDG